MSHSTPSRQGRIVARILPIAFVRREQAFAISQKPKNLATRPAEVATELPQLTGQKNGAAHTWQRQALRELQVAERNIHEVCARMRRGEVESR